MYYFTEKLLPRESQCNPFYWAFLCPNFNVLDPTYEKMMSKKKLLKEDIHRMSFFQWTTVFNNNSESRERAFLFLFFFVVVVSFIKLNLSKSKTSFCCASDLNNLASISKVI